MKQKKPKPPDVFAKAPADAKALAKEAKRLLRLKHRREWWKENGQ